MMKSGEKADLLVIEETGESVANETAQNSARHQRVKSEPPPIPRAP